MTEKTQKGLSDQEQLSGTKCLATVVIVAFLFALPAIYSGFPKDSHDAPAQFNLTQAFSQQFWNGEFYPRWLFEMNDGFGSPTFFFYPPLAYFLTTLIGIFTGQNDAQIWQQLGFSAALAIIASGIACYLWLKDSVNSISAMIGAIIYLVVPYHITTDLFTRGALAELWAFVWMPLVLKFVGIIRQKPIVGLIGTSISYSLLVMTHLPTVLLFSLIPIVYAFFAFPSDKRKATLIVTVMAMAIGIGIADIYFLPAMAARNYIMMEPNPQSPLYFANNFLLPFSANGYTPYITELTFFLLTMTGGVILSFFGGKFDDELKLQKRFWLVISAITILMMIPLSKPIWEVFSTLQSVQFPYRFNSILCVALAALTALASAKIILSNEFLSKNKGASAFVGGLIILGFVWVGFFVKTINAEKVQPNEVAYRNKILSQKLEFVESMPKTARMDLLDNLIAEKQKSGTTHFLRLENPQAKAEIEVWQTRNIVLKVNSPNPTTLTVGQFYYPGWEAFSTNESGQLSEKVEVKPSEEGLLKTQIPAGKGQLKIALVQSDAEKSGLQTSLISIVALLVGAFILWRYKKKFGLGEVELENGK